MESLQSIYSDSVCSAYPDEPLAATPDASVADVLQLLRAQKTGAVLVCNEQGLLGIFTERDALKVMAEGADLSEPITSVMSHDPVTLSEMDTVAVAIQKMAEGGYRHLPVLAKDGQPLGMAGVHGIVHYLVDHFPDTVYNLPPNARVKQHEREGA